MYNCQHQKELSIVQKDISHMAFEVDDLKRSFDDLMKHMQQAIKTTTKNLVKK